MCVGLVPDRAWSTGDISRTALGHSLLHIRTASLFAMVAALALPACSLLTACGTRQGPTGRLPAFTPEQARVAPAPGEYTVTFRSNFFGPVQAVMNVEHSRGVVIAHTREGTAWKMIGGLERLLGPIFLPSFFPRGALLTWETALPDEATGEPGEGWIGISPAGQYRATTRMHSLDGPIDVLFRDGRVICTMELSSAPPKPVDYARLLDSVEARTRETLFDADLGTSQSMARYFDDVRRLLPNVTDDVSFYFAAGLGWRRYTHLPLSLAYRPAEKSDPVGEARGASSARPLRLVWDESQRIATIEALVFDDTDAIDRVLSQAIAKQPVGIIIDLRSCTGFDLSALWLASRLIDTPLNAGVFFNTRWREAIQNGTVDSADIPVVSITSSSDIAAAHARLEESGAIRVIVNPAPDTFRGPVAILADARTRSTGEILAAVLQAPNQRPVMGGRTADRARVSFERDVGQGFMVRVPEFDWAPNPGEPFRGVRPNTRAGREESIKAAVKFIKGAQAVEPTEPSVHAEAGTPHSHR
jgi:hypothetical protein